MNLRYRLILVLIISFAGASLVTAQPTDPEGSAGILPDNTDVVFVDDFQAGGLAEGWSAWDHFPDVRDGHMIIEGWQSWGDAVGRPNIHPDEGVLQLFQYQTGPMEFFLDYSNYSDDNYRNVRLGSSGGDQWNLYTSAGAEGRLTRTYGGARLIPDTWYYVLFYPDPEGHFHVQVWERDNPVNIPINADIAPAGDGWTGHDWWFGNKVYTGTLVIDRYEELSLGESYHPPCTVRSVSAVNLRSAPGTDQPPVGRLDPELQLRVVGQATGSDGYVWWQLFDTSWVRSDVVREAGSCEELPDTGR